MKHAILNLKCLKYSTKRNVRYFRGYCNFTPTYNYKLNPNLRFVPVRISFRILKDGRQYEEGAVIFKWKHEVALSGGLASEKIMDLS